MAFTPLPYDEDMLSTFDPSIDTLYNEILLDSPSSLSTQPSPSPSSFNHHEIAAIKEALDNLHNSDYSSTQPSPSPFLSTSPSPSPSPSSSLSTEPSPSPSSFNDHEIAAIKEALDNLHNSDYSSTQPSPSPSLSTEPSPSPSSQYNNHEMAAIKEALDNLHNSEFISTGGVGMIHEGGQATYNLNSEPHISRTERISNENISQAVQLGRISAGETSRSTRELLGLPSTLRANCRSEASCSQLRNYIGDSLGTNDSGFSYHNPGRPIEGTDSHPVPPFPGPCWRKLSGTGPLTQFPAGSSECMAPFAIRGGKTRSSRRSGKKNSPPSRMSRRTRRSRRSTRKAGRKGRRATRRSRK